MSRSQRIPTVVNLGFLDRSRYYFFQVAPQLYSRGWVDPVPHPLPLRKEIQDSGFKKLFKIWNNGSETITDRHTYGAGSDPSAHFVTTIWHSILKILLHECVTPVDNSTGSLTICYISFRTINFPCFLQYSFPVLHVIEWFVEADV
jgi:hypothetical protein